VQHDVTADHAIESPQLDGPHVGLSAALAYVTHFPNNVASLLIGDGPGIAPSNNGSVINKIVNSGFWRQVFKIAGAATFVQAGNALCYVNYVPNEEEISDYITSYSGRIGPITEWFRKYPESLAYVDPKLEDIDKPVLVFWGAQDQLLLVENSQRLSKRLRRSKLQVFENCGHYSYQDQHEAFLSMVINWVSNEHKAL
jgi:pimeloyl-ACP methyl ester carboxylesterase